MATRFLSPVAAATADLGPAAVLLVSMQEEDGEACVIVVVEPEHEACTIVSVCSKDSIGGWHEDLSTEGETRGAIGQWVYVCEAAPEGVDLVEVDYLGEQYTVRTKHGWFGFSFRDPRWTLEALPRRIE